MTPIEPGIPVEPEPEVPVEEIPLTPLEPSIPVEPEEPESKVDKVIIQDILLTNKETTNIILDNVSNYYFLKN